ncbi:MAG: histidine kinase [Bacteroidota bacterium]|nr:histidine kinase [Bacteroidota bacterium]
MDLFLIKLFVVINVLSVGVLFYLLRLSRKRYSLLKRMEAMRNRIARDLHDDIGATLSSISFYCEAITRRIHANKIDEGLKVLDKMGVQSREMIENMNDIVWMVNPKNDKMDRLFERLEDYGKSLFTSQGINFIFYADPQLLSSTFAMDIRKDFYLLCKEALNNAAKYAQCSTVELLIKKKGKELITIIRDDGMGFVLNEDTSGNGLLNMQVRANHIGGKLVIDTKSGQGTAISFVSSYPPNW